MVSWRTYFPFLSIPFLGLSAVFLQDALSHGLASRSVAKSWIQVPGRVLSKKVAVIPSKSSNGSKQATYRPSVTYEYQVEGRTFQCDHVDCLWASSSGDPAESENSLRRYFPGQELTVFANPSDPAQAVLDPRPLVSWVGIMAGMALGTLGSLWGFFLSVIVSRVNRLPVATGDEGAIAPQFEYALPGPAFFALGWVALSASGVAAALLSSDTTGVIWGVLALQAAMSSVLWVWLVPKMLLRRHFRGCRLTFSGIPVTRDRESMWMIETPRARLTAPRFFQVLRFFKKVSFSAPFHAGGSEWCYEERFCRELEAHPGGKGWAGLIRFRPSDPASVGTAQEGSQWLFKIKDGSYEALFPLPEPLAAQS